MDGSIEQCCIRGGILDNDFVIPGSIGGQITGVGVVPGNGQGISGLRA